MKRFTGHRALITAAGQGIGAATARRLAAEGCAVLVTDIVADRAAAVAAEIGGHSFVCDVADDTSVRAAVAHAVEVLGGLDVLVNNAYANHPDAPLVDDDDDEAGFNRDLDVCLTGAFRCARAAMPHLAAAQGRGVIVNVGSVNAERHFGGHSYSAAKAGLTSLTRTLAVQNAPRGVRVNLVEPGTIRTPAWAGRDDVFDRVAGHYPLGRVGEPEDIADAIAFLASADARWITGVTLPVDGGLLVSNLGFNRAMSGDG